MNRTLEKNVFQKNCQINSTKLSIKDIKKFYTPQKNKNLIGLEYERLSLNKNDYTCAKYDVVAKIIEIFSKENDWELIYDNKTIIGAKAKDNTSISLEPGCQMEISLAPKKNIIDIDLILNKIINSLDKIADSLGVIFLGYGINPKDNIEEIPLLNKRRYVVMNNYLPNVQSGYLAKYMMRKTAGIQINIDYNDEYDAYYKLKFFNLIMPFISALCSNSPFENNFLYDKKSLRANVWQNVGKDRCNLFYQDIFKNNILNNNLFEKYINQVLKIPMIFIERENKIIPINGEINFEEFIKKGYKDYCAQYNDYILHQSLCFPDVRLKNYIEIRNHDSAEPKIAIALCAFYKGLIKENFKELLEKFNFLKIDKIEEYNLNSINCALNFKINNSISTCDILEKLFDISINNLNSFDKMYLNPLIDMIKNKKTNADLIIENKINNTKELINFLAKY